MNTTEKALAVLVLDRKIRHWLKRNDPKAYEQAFVALCEVMPDASEKIAASDDAPPTEDNPLIEEVLLSSGEVPLEVDKGESLQDALDQAGLALDEVSLNNVVVVKTVDGRYFTGDFGFTFEEVTKDEAMVTVRDFGHEEETEAEDDEEQ